MAIIHSLDHTDRRFNACALLIDLSRHVLTRAPANRRNRIRLRSGEDVVPIKHRQVTAKHDPRVIPRVVSVLHSDSILALANMNQPFGNDATLAVVAGLPLLLGLFGRLSALRQG